MALAEIRNAENKDHARTGAQPFADDHGAKWPKPVAKAIVDHDVLLVLTGYPAERWIRLRTTNPIESTCATLWLR